MKASAPYMQSMALMLGIWIHIINIIKKTILEILESSLDILIRMTMTTVKYQINILIL